MKYGVSSNENIKVLNSMRSTKKNKETNYYFNKLNPHLQRLVEDKGSELANLILKEDNQQLGNTQIKFPLSDIKIPNLDISAVKGTPDESFYSYSKQIRNHKYSNSVVSLPKNKRNNNFRNIQRSCAISPLKQPSQLEISFLTENSQIRNLNFVKSFDRTFNFKIDVADKENEKLMKLIEFNENVGNSSRISFMSKRYKAVADANSRKIFFDSTHQLEKSQIYRHQYNVFDIDGDIRNQTEEY